MMPRNINGHVSTRPALPNDMNKASQTGRSREKEQEKKEKRKKRGNPPVATSCGGCEASECELNGWMNPIGADSHDQQLQADEDDDWSATCIVGSSR
jgi:hypothetical protein